MNRVADSAVRLTSCPDGWQVHIAGPSENGWRIVNVVPSQEQFEERPAVNYTGPQAR